MKNFMFCKKKDNSKFDYNSDIQVYGRIIKEALLPKIHWFILAIVLMSVNASSVAYRAYLVKPAIDKVFLNKDLHALVIIPLLLILVAIVASASSFLSGYIMETTTEKINMSYKKRLFEKLIYFDLDFFQNKSSHKILDLFADISGLMTALSLIVNGVVKQLLTMIGLIALMFYQNFTLSCLAFVGFPIVVVPVYLFGRNLKKIAADGRELSGKVSATMGESLNLIELVKSNNSESMEINRFNRFLNITYKLAISMKMKYLVASPMMEFAGSIGFALVIWYGGRLVINGVMTAGSFFTFMTALFSIYKPAKSFAGLNVQIQMALTCAKRLFLMLDKEPKIKDKSNAIVIQDVKGDVDFENVVFSYPIHDKKEPLVVEKEIDKLSDTIALNNLNLHIKHGQSIALVGHSGSGKSTIFKLLLRFYDVLQGQIKIDGIDIRNISLKSLRDNISMVSQNVLLFNASIKENIRHTIRNATDEEVIRACKMANADEFIEQLDDKYDTVVGPNGCVLSGGQKQRLSIARAILKNAPILLLDEATSALDTISEKLIQKSLKTLMQGKTTVVIAHRLTTIQNCDVICVLKQGQIIEMGSHDELMAKNSAYATLYRKQFEKVS